MYKTDYPAIIYKRQLKIMTTIALRHSSKSALKIIESKNFDGQKLD